MLLVRSSEFPGPKVVLVLGEARTAPENFLQEIGLRESAGRPEESDRLIESQDRIGILRDDVDIVRDQKDRDVRFSLQPVKALIEHVFAADVDRGGRLVEEEDIRPIEDGPCDEDALHLSPRENVEPLREDRASETDRGERLFEARPAFEAEEVADGDRHICHHEVLRNISDPNRLGPGDRPGVWHEPEEDAEKGRLPGAVRADDGERGPSPYAETDVFQNRDVIQSNPEVRNLEDVCPSGGVAGWTRRRRAGDHASRPIRWRYLRICPVLINLKYRV